MTEEKQILLDTLHREVVMMREAQRNYYRIIRSNGTLNSIKGEALKQAKRWEAKVDNTIEQINKLPQQKFSF